MKTNPATFGGRFAWFLHILAILDILYVEVQFGLANVNRISLVQFVLNIVGVKYPHNVLFIDQLSGSTPTFQFVQNLNFKCNTPTHIMLMNRPVCGACKHISNKYKFIFQLQI